jgi:hypothetical protein
LAMEGVFFGTDTVANSEPGDIGSQVCHTNWSEASARRR